MKNCLKNLFVLSVASVSTFALSAQEAERHAIATYNIRYTNTADNVANNSEGKSWDLRGPYVHQIVVNYDFDIVGFQEVTGRSGGNSMAHGTGKSQLEEMKAWMDEDYDFFEWERDGNSAGKDYSYNLMAYKSAKYESLDNGVFWLSPTPDTPSNGWDADYTIRRTCGWSKMKVKATGEEFIFAVTHCNYAPSLDGPNGGRLMVERLSAIAGDLPVVLVGDFNMRPTDHQAAFREYMAYFNHARTSADETLCIPESNGQIAWTTTEWTTADKATSGSEFDHLFYRNMHAHNYYVITENFGRGINPSDHYPVMVEFTLGNETDDIYVDAKAAAGDGSKEAPFATIAEALDVATAGNKIHVTADTYTEKVTIETPVTLVGGYDAGFENIIGKTIVDAGGDKSRMFYSLNCGVEIENFKFCNSNSTLASTDGVFATDGAVLKLTNVEFADNTGYATGGGLYSTAVKVDIHACSFTGNTAPDGAAAYITGASDVEISGSEFSGNTATKHGVLYLGVDEKCTIWNNTFANNALTAKSVRQDAVAMLLGGAAIYADLGDNISPELNLGHNTVVGNDATYTGKAAVFTGAAINVYGGTVNFVNNIIAGNSTVAELGYGDVAADEVTKIVSAYNIYTSATSIGYTAGSGDITAADTATGVAALASTLDGVSADGKFAATLSDCGGTTRVVKPIAKTYAGAAIDILKETSRIHRQLKETDFDVDLNRDGTIDGVLTIDQRGVAREEITIPGACEYIAPAAGIEDVISQSGISIAPLSSNRYAISGIDAGDCVAVYSVSGATVIADKADAAEYLLDLGGCAPGIYVISVGDIAVKVIVK